MSWNNHDAVHRHACHAWEDFSRLRSRSHNAQETQELWHSISHHLRHVVHRSGLEVAAPRRKQVRRAHVDKSHR